MFYIFLADGFEEVEALAPVDILRRAKIPVTTVGVGGELIRGSHNICVKADICIDDLVLGEDTEGVILPGGMPGTRNLDASAAVRSAVTYCADRGLCVCAICAAPSVLGHMGLLRGKRATCFPGFEGELDGALTTGEKVTADGNIITAKGAGCALEFGFAITALARGQEAADAVASAMQTR